MRGVEHIPWLYDACMSLLERAGLGRWRRRLTSGARGLTLEIGCGTGRNLPLYPAGVTVIGLEPELDSIRRARRRAPRALLVVARAEALPFRDGCFDTVVSSLVFCSVSHPRRCLAEVQRVLCDGGELRMLEHVRHPQPRWARLQDHIQPFWTRFTGGCHPNRDTVAAVREAGFTIRSEERAAFGILRRVSARHRKPPS